MKLACTALLALALPFLAAGCTAEASSDPSGNDNASSEATTVAEQIESVLKGVTSPETAEAAKTQLNDLAEKLRNALPTMPTAEEGKSMLESVKQNATKAMGAWKGDLADVLKRIAAEVQRIAGDSQLAQPLQAALDKLSKAMEPK